MLRPLLRGAPPQLKAASGLALLDGKKYKLAARRFVEVPPELGAEFSDVLAAQDVALYGGLTALASFDRAELKTRVRPRACRGGAAWHGMMLWHLVGMMRCVDVSPRPAAGD